MSDTWFLNFLSFVAPKEIEARGERAQLVYQRALRDGAVSVQRSRILLIGQDRAGKTSLKKSLIGLPFNRNENSTEGIEVDPSIFQVDADEVKNWQPIDKSERGLLGCSKDVAQMVVEKLCFQEEEEDAEIHNKDQLKNENYRSGTKADDAEGERETIHLWTRFVSSYILAFVLYFNQVLLIAEIGGPPTLTNLV